MSKSITKLIKIHISTFVFVVNMKRFLCKRKTNLFTRASRGALEFKLGFKGGLSFGFVLFSVQKKNCQRGPCLNFKFLCPLRRMCWLALSSAQLAIYTEKVCSLKTYKKYYIFHWASECLLEIRIEAFILLKKKRKSAKKNNSFSFSIFGLS